MTENVTERNTEHDNTQLNMMKEQQTTRDIIMITTAKQD